MKDLNDDIGSELYAATFQEYYTSNFKKLVLSKKKISKYGIQVILCEAVRVNFLREVKFLLENRKEFVKELQKNHSPLYIAVKEGHLDMVRLLLSYNAKFPNYSRLIQGFVLTWKKEIIKLLIERGKLDISTVMG